MKYLGLALTSSLLCISSAYAENAPSIAVIDSKTPAKALMARPGTFLGETFVFEETHSGEVKIQVGVWEAGMGELILDNFPFTEYVLMISGKVTVKEKDGEAKTFEAGDTFVIPKGWTGIWNVKERMKKQIVRIGTAN